MDNSRRGSAVGSNEQVRLFTQHQDTMMKPANQIIGSLLLLVLLSCVCHVSAQLRSGFNGHWYVKKVGTTYQAALDGCADYNKNGNESYLVTINHQQEWVKYLEFLISNNLILTTDRAWLSGSDSGADGMWTFRSGPEAGNQFYNTYTDQCFTNCHWNTFQPNMLASDHYLNSVTIAGNSEIAWDNNSPAGTTSNSYVCEIVDKLEPKLSAPLPTTGGTIRISNIQSFDKTSLSVTFKRIGSTYSFVCDSITTVDTSTVDCQVGANSGVFEVTITDASTTSRTAIYQFQPPFVSYVYPAYTAGQLVTIVGKNLADNDSQLPQMSIAVGPNKTPCNQITLIYAGAAVTCVVSVTLPAATTFFPLFVTLNGVTAESRKAPFYYPANGLFYSAYLGRTPSEIAFGAFSQNIVIGSPGHPGIVFNDNAFKQALIKTILPPVTDSGATYVFWAPIKANSTANGYIWSMGPKIGKNVALLHQNILAQSTYPYTYTLNAATNPIGTSTTGPGAPGLATLTEIGGETPVIQVPSVPFSIPTSGQTIAINVDFAGHLFSSVSITQPSSGLTLTLEPRDPNHINTFKFTIPPFFGNNFVFGLKIDNIVATNTITFSSAVPTITSVTTIPVSGNHTVTITGTNFYNDASIVSITIGQDKKICTSPTFVTPHTSISCTAPDLQQGTYIISLKYASYSTTSSITYSAIVISNINQTDSYLEIEGSKLGSSDQNIRVEIGDITIPKTDFVQSSFGSWIKINIPENVKSGIIKVLVDDLQSNGYQFAFVPIIQSVGPAVPVTGGPITITGKFLSPVDQDNNQVNTSVIISGVDQPLDCTYISNVSPYVLECQVPAGSGAMTVQLQTGAKVSTSALPLSYQHPTITLASSLYFGEPGNITISGSNFADKVLMITVGSTDCHPTNFISDTQVACYFDATAPATSGQTLNVTVSVNGLESTNQVFMYFTKHECPGTPTVCAGHGKCNIETGICACDTNWGTSNCSVYTISGMPPTTDNEGGTIIPTESGLDFKIKITHLRERDYTSTIIRTLPMSQITWVSRTSQGDVQTFLGRFDNDTVSVQLALTTISEAKTIIFAGESIDMPANSIKYTITISNWTFAASSNSMQVIYTTETAKATSIKCSTSDTELVAPTSDTLSWFEVHAGDTIMRARYSGRMYVDQRILRSTVTNLPATDDLYKATNTTTDFNVFTSIDVPFFHSSAILDPNFGSLVKAGDTSDGCSESKNKWKIPVIVVCTVVGAAFIIGALFYFSKKGTIREKLIRLKSRK
eukprot:gene4946-5745_t